MAQTIRVNGLQTVERGPAETVADWLERVLSPYRAVNGQIAGANYPRLVEVFDDGVALDVVQPLDLTSIRAPVVFDWTAAVVDAALTDAETAVCLMDSTSVRVVGLRVTGTAGVGLLESRALERGHRSAGKNVFERCTVDGSWRRAAWMSIGAENSVVEGGARIANSRTANDASLALLGDNYLGVPAQFGLTPSNAGTSEITYDLQAPHVRNTGNGAGAGILIRGFDGVSMWAPWVLSGTAPHLVLDARDQNVAGCTVAEIATHGAPLSDGSGTATPADSIVFEGGGKYAGVRISARSLRYSTGAPIRIKAGAQVFGCVVVHPDGNNVLVEEGVTAADQNLFIERDAIRDPFGRVRVAGGLETSDDIYMADDRGVRWDGARAIKLRGNDTGGELAFWLDVDGERPFRVVRRARSHVDLEFPGYAVKRRTVVDNGTARERIELVDDDQEGG